MQHRSGRQVRRRTRRRQRGLAAAGLVGAMLTGVLAAPAVIGVAEAAWSDRAAAASPVCTRVWNWNVYTDFTGVGDWDGDGFNDIISLGGDGTLRLHRGTGPGQLACPVVMGTAPATADRLVGLEKSPGRGPALLVTTTGVNPATGLPSQAFTAMPAALSDGKLHGLTSWVDDAQGWNTFDSVVAAPGLTTGQSTLVTKWPRVTKSNLFGYLMRPNNKVEQVVGEATHDDWVPGMYGWQEWFPGESLVGVGDWDGDGYGDLGAITGVNGPGGVAGRMLLYRGNGTGPRGLVSSGIEVGYGWDGFTKVQSGYDYTGDGRPDIIGLNPVSGSLCLWAWVGPGAPAGRIAMS